MGSRAAAPGLDGTVAVVAGGGGGIGAAIVRRLAAGGATVVAADLDDERARAAADAAGAIAMTLDVTSEESWASLVESVVGRLGEVGVLVNGAGIVHFGSIRRTSPADYRRVVEVNQTGVFLGTRAVVDSMTRRGGGSIVNLSSTAGLRGSTGQIAYVASKWAVTGMTQAAAAELAPRGIRVNSVHPGPTATDMLAAAPAGGTGPVEGTLLGRPATPEEVAAAVAFLASEESSYCTGTNLVVDGGSLAFLPGHVARPQAQ